MPTCPINCKLERIESPIYKRCRHCKKETRVVDCIEVRCDGVTIKRFCGFACRLRAHLYVYLAVERTEPKITPH